jgi:hypothetical protein
MIRSLIGATVGAFGGMDGVGLARTGEASMAEASSMAQESLIQKSAVLLTARLAERRHCSAYAGHAPRTNLPGRRPRIASGRSAHRDGRPLILVARLETRVVAVPREHSRAEASVRGV